MNTYLLFPEGKEKALTLSYDDGVDTDIRFIELLEKFNIKCTFNINSGCFSPEGSVRPESQVHFRLSESEVKMFTIIPCARLQLMALHTRF